MPQGTAGTSGPHSASFIIARWRHLILTEVQKSSVNSPASSALLGCCFPWEHAMFIQLWFCSCFLLCSWISWLLLSSGSLWRFRWSLNYEIGCECVYVFIINRLHTERRGVPKECVKRKYSKTWSLFWFDLNHFLQTTSGDIIWGRSNQTLNSPPLLHAKCHPLKMCFSPSGDFGFSTFPVSLWTFC